jgi:hypothetical protein
LFELCKHKRGNKGGINKGGIKGENQPETNPNNCDIIATNTTYLEKNAQYPTYYYTNTPYFVTFEGRRTINFRKVQKMNYLEKAIFGLEMEGSNPCITTVRQMVRDNNWQNAITVVTDASSGVKWELNISPMANCLTAWNFLESLNQELNRINATVSVGCGLHVHISNKLIAENVTAEEFTRTSLDRWNTNSGAVLSLLEADTMPFVLVQDILYRYTKNRPSINRFLARSRHDNRFCRFATNLQGILDATSIAGLDNMTHGKFSAVNLRPWTNGTIEFRQHQGTLDHVKISNWVKFLLNLITHSAQNRIEQSGQTSQNVTTPDMPFRRNTRIGVTYQLARRAGGVSTQEIMDETGHTEGDVRRQFSEIRTRFRELGLDDTRLIVTHNQQSYGNRYGSGTNLNGYEILREFETLATSEWVMKPENTIGSESVFASLEDSVYEYIRTRMDNVR